MTKSKAFTDLFPKEFIELQFIFAKKVSEIMNISFLDALFDYTSMPVRIGVPFSEMKKEHPLWVNFLKLIKSENDFEKAYEYHKTTTLNSPPMRDQYGFCSYDYYAPEYLVNIHFANSEPPIPGLLSDVRMPVRLEELKNMFKIIYKEHPDTKEVKSSSWLFNIEKFKKLFPQEFFQNNIIKWDFHSLGIWGQFIDKYGNIKKPMYDEFVKSIEKAKTLDEIKQAFALKCIKCWSTIEPFYKMYETKV